MLGAGATGIYAGTDAQARELATTGAVTHMVSHGLITGALFLETLVHTTIAMLDGPPLNAVPWAGYP